MGPGFESLKVHQKRDSRGENSWDRDRSRGRKRENGPLVKRSRRRPLTPETGVRFPDGSPCGQCPLPNSGRIRRKSKGLVHEGLVRTKSEKKGIPPPKKQKTVANAPKQWYNTLNQITISEATAFDIQSVSMTMRSHLFPSRTQ